MTIRMLILGACLSFAATTAATEVYKWTDAQGNVHYGDRQPEGVAAEEVNVRTGPVVSPSSRVAPRPPESQDEQPANEQADEQQRAEAEQQRQKNCEIARSNLQTIETNSRIQIEDAGSRRYLTPEEIETKRAEMQQIVDDSCGESANDQ